jgi:hypothetical protein
VWIYTQSNITSIIFTWVHYTNTEKIHQTVLFLSRLVLGQPRIQLYSQGAIWKIIILIGIKGIKWLTFKNTVNCLYFVACSRSFMVGCQRSATTRKPSWCPTYHTPVSNISRYWTGQHNLKVLITKSIV